MRNAKRSFVACSRLERVVPVTLPSLIQSRAATSELANRILGTGYRFGCIENVILMEGRQNDHAVGISSHQISRSHSDVPNGYRNLSRLELHPVLTRSHPVTAGKNRIPELTTQGDVATDPIYHRARQASSVRNLGEDIAPHRDILAPAVIENENRTGSNIIDIVPNSPRRLRGWAVQESEGAPRHAKLLGSRLNLRTLPVDAQLIECIAQGGAVESRGALYVDIGCHRPSISS
jgi:hypothetical protein